MGFKQWMIYFLRRLLLPRSLKTMEWTMLRLINKDRKAYGIKSLFMQDDLRKVAKLHSKDMARKDYFEHKNLDGESHADRYKEAQISEVTSGENLAKIGGYKFPVRRAEIGLMNSPGHRKNILNKTYNCVGIGIHKSEKQVYFYTQNFAYRSIILKGKIPKSIRMKKTLSLGFKPVHNLAAGIYRILDNNEVIQEKSFRITNGYNKIKVKFKRAGFLTIQIYTGKRGSQKLQISNEFKIRVRKGWLS